MYDADPNGKTALFPKGYGAIAKRIQFRRHVPRWHESRPGKQISNAFGCVRLPRLKSAWHDMIPNIRGQGNRSAPVDTAAEDSPPITISLPGLTFRVNYNSACRSTPLPYSYVVKAPGLLPPPGATTTGDCPSVLPLPPDSEQITRVSPGVHQPGPLAPGLDRQSPHR